MTVRGSWMPFLLIVGVGLVFVAVAYYFSFGFGFMPHETLPPRLQQIIDAIPTP